VEAEAEAAARNFEMEPEFGGRQGEGRESRRFSLSEMAKARIFYGNVIKKKKRNTNLTGRPENLRV